VAIRNSGASGAAAFGATPGRLTSLEGKRVTVADDLETTKRLNLNQKRPWAVAVNCWKI
jgi:hypothetical protein